MKEGRKEEKRRPIMIVMNVNDKKDQKIQTDL